MNDKNIHFFFFLSFHFFFVSFKWFDVTVFVYVFYFSGDKLPPVLFHTMLSFL